MSSGVNAQASGGCPTDDSQIATLAHKALAQHGRVAEFNTLFVPGNKTAEITLHEPYEQASKYTFYAAVSTGKGKEPRALAVLGIDKIVKDDKVWTRLIVSVPGAGWLWPRRTFFVLGCTADGKPALAAELSAAVSNRGQSALLAILFIAAVYAGVSFGCRAPQGPWTLNPIRLTTGLTGRGSISNLQTFFFTEVLQSTSGLMLGKDSLRLGN